MLSTRRGNVLDIVVALFSASLVSCYNIDLEHPVVYQGPEGTFFGYSVLEHHHDNTRWVLVGAPKANSSFSSSVSSPGAVFKCRVHSNPDKRCTEMDLGRGNTQGTSCGKTCQGDQDNEWMGVSLARQDKENGNVLACAHRWKNVYYAAEQILPHGFCSVIPPNLQGSTRSLIPCYEEYKKKYGEEHGSCQAGIAGFFTEELVVMGAPGSYYWTGTVKVLNLTSNSFYNLKNEVVGASRYSYLGYAVTAGHFSSPTATDVVGGAPQDGDKGKVHMFKIDKGSLVKIFQASGKKMGSYFGSSLCAVDLNRDGLSDLLVGAPMFSEIRDEGQVSVFLSRGNGVMEEKEILNGDNAYNAHFGESIAILGDIDDDGFPDVAIGAPKEDDYAGAVYIYHGDADGIVNKYSMRLSGQSINPGLRMFGQSISGTVDMDGNAYPDVTIGAFMSDNVVLLRSRPVITVDISIFLPVSINITAPECHDGSQHLNCLRLIYNLTADVTKKEKGQPSRVLFALNGELASTASEMVSLSVNSERCQHYVAYVRKEVKDVFSPIVFEAAYSLGPHVIENKDEKDKELPPLMPVLRWKKGDKIAQRNQTWFEKNCLSEDCAADLRLLGKLLLSGVHSRPHLALGGVKNISLNLSISNAGDDAYDTNIYFNFSKELYFIKMWQKVMASGWGGYPWIDDNSVMICFLSIAGRWVNRRASSTAPRAGDCKYLRSSAEDKGISCELLELDFLKCSVGFPFMRAQTKYHLAVIFDTSHLSGAEENLAFLVTAQSANPEHESKLSDNTLLLSIPLVHEVDTAITGLISPTTFAYGDSIDASHFMLLEDMVCHFQPLNFTFQVINNGPSSLPGSTVHIRIPNRLVGSGADMFHILDTEVVEDRGNCTFHRNPTPCNVPQDKENIFHTIFSFFTKSGRKVLDCDRPGRSCLMITCHLGSLAKEETQNIDVRMLLNTEILKRDSSSVIQFVTRGSVMVDNRAVEVPNGLPEDTSVSGYTYTHKGPIKDFNSSSTAATYLLLHFSVYTIIALVQKIPALYNQESGYLQCSCLVESMFFLSLWVSVTLMGFFRRRYKEIIEAEKNRKDSDESWDWVQKSQ
ncbi:ITA9 protein, partial [Amia calva]|nr:ITA9 protein [Amia calva]